MPSAAATSSAVLVSSGRPANWLSKALRRRSVSGSGASGARNVEHAGKFKQGERVPGRLGQHPVAAADGQAVAEELGRGLSGQALKGQLGQPGGGEGTGPGAQQQHDRLGVQPPGGEQQGVGAGPVQPLRVVDHAQQRLVGGELGQQRQDREPDQEAVGRPRLGQPESSAQRLRLHVGKRVDPVEGRAQQQVQPGEGQLGLLLDSGPADDPEAVGPRGRRG